MYIIYDVYIYICIVYLPGLPGRRGPRRLAELLALVAGEIIIHNNNDNDNNNSIS